MTLDVVEALSNDTNNNKHKIHEYKRNTLVYDKIM